MSLEALLRVSWRSLLFGVVSSLLGVVFWSRLSPSTASRLESASDTSAGLQSAPSALIALDDADTPRDLQVMAPRGTAPSLTSAPNEWPDVCRRAAIDPPVSDVMNDVTASEAFVIGLSTSVLMLSETGVGDVVTDLGMEVALAEQLASLHPLAGVSAVHAFDLRMRSQVKGWLRERPETDLSKQLFLMSQGNRINAPQSYAPEITHPLVQRIMVANAWDHPDQFAEVLNALPLVDGDLMACRDALHASR